MSPEEPKKNQILTRWLLGIIGSLTALGIASLVVVYGNQRAIAQKVETNKQMAESTSEKATQNEKGLAVIVSKFDSFVKQYDKDQELAEKQRREILDAVKK